MENIRAQSWYNGEPARYLNGYLNDKSNRLIGWTTMRQLRVQNQSCSDQRLIFYCEHDYSYFNEEIQSYNPGWKNQSNTREEEYSSSIVKAFEYQLSKNLDTYLYAGEHGIYSGNGYVYEFRGSLSNLKSNLSKLHQLGWIDQKTRAILIQMTLYNPNVQLFTLVTLSAEFLSSGGVLTSARFEPLNFYGKTPRGDSSRSLNCCLVCFFSVFSSLLQLICTIIYMLMIIYLMYEQLRLVLELKWKYLREFWCIIDLGLIVCSWTSVGVYIWRFQESNRISRIFAQTNGYVYVNIQRAVYVNDLLTYLQGFCCFFGLIKFVRLCRIDSRLSLFLRTLSNAGKELGLFLLMFSIVFMSFISLFYLLFVAKIWSCSDLLSTAQMLFEVTLMKFDTSELLVADPILGPVCFAIFIFIVVFVCLSMFLTIINQSFRRARDQRFEGEEMLAFVGKKVLRWIGLKKASWEELQEERDTRMRSQYFHPIENFPDRIDQLLEALTRVSARRKKETYRLFVCF